MAKNESLLAFINYFLNHLNLKETDTKITIDKKKLRNEFDFYSFEDNDIFYAKILSHFLNDDDKIIKNLVSSSKVFQRNLFVFLEYLRALIIKYNYEDLYKDTIVKLDISLIIGYLVNKYGAQIVESIEFFPSCIKELEKKYKKNVIGETIFDNDLKKDAKEKLVFLKVNKIKNFKKLLLYLQNYYTTSDTYSQNDSYEIDEIYSKYGNLTADEIDNNYINNEDFKKAHLEKYLENILKTNGYDNINYKVGKDKELYEQKKKELKNHLFYSEILKVDLNDINDCMYLIYFKSTLYKDTPFYNIDEEFKKLLLRKKINDFTDNLKKIIEDESFIKNLKEILNQKSVKEYFEKSRRFIEEEEDNNEVEFIEKENVKDDGDYLTDGFDRFINFINNDKCFFTKLFIIKYLPKYKRAFVDQNMRIIINPLYFGLSDSLNDEKRNEIFKAYLFIIILNVIFDLVKFMKEQSFKYSNISQIPKRKEDRNMFINYLFNMSMICSISYKQALVINKPENWNKPELLSNIFKEQRKWYEENKKTKKEDNSLPQPKEEDAIRFYLSLEDDDNEEQISNNVIDIWYDID